MTKVTKLIRGAAGDGARSVKGDIGHRPGRSQPESRLWLFCMFFFTVYLSSSVE